jgi:hypothetical protein
MSANLHDADFYAWTQQQTRLLKSGKLSEIDIRVVSDVNPNQFKELQSL